MVKNRKNGSKTKKSQKFNFSCSPLTKWNSAVEGLLTTQSAGGQSQPVEDLPAEIWDQWLWHTNPQEAPSADCMLNHNQLLGLLICRFRAGKFDAMLGHVPFSSSQLKIVDKNICQMTLRELRDTLANVTLQWAQVVQAGENIHMAMRFLDMCFHRFGEFCWASWPEANDASQVCRFAHCFSMYSKWIDCVL